MQAKRTLLAVVALALVALAVWWLGLRDTPVPARGAATADRAASSAATSHAPSSGSAVIAMPTSPAPRAQPGAPATPAQLAIRDQIRDAADLRALYERMKNEPDPTGEASYRMAEAIFECAPFVDKTLAQVSARLNIAKKPDSPERTAALQWMVARCAGFSGMGTGLMDLYHDLHRQAAGAAYPAAVARSLRDEPGRNDLARSDATAVALLVSQPDPDVLLEISRYLEVRNGSNWLARSGGPDAQTWSLAWGFLQCTYGADCGPASRPVMLSCMLMSTCGAMSVEDSLIAQGTPPQTLRAAGFLRDRLAQQLANRDWAGLGFIPLEPSQGAPR